MFAFSLKVQTLLCRQILDNYWAVTRNLTAEIQSQEESCDFWKNKQNSVPVANKKLPLA